MNKVFISGSRMLWRLNQQMIHCLDNYMRDSATVLIGDANGADKAVQKYLAQKKYEEVVVFCMHNYCRNNLGNWEIKTAISAKKKKDANYFRIKDDMMANEANLGFVLWDGKSKGAFHNIVNLVMSDKPTMVFFQPNGSVHNILSLSDFYQFVARYKISDSEELKTIVSHLRKSKEARSNKAGKGNASGLQGSLFE